MKKILSVILVGIMSLSAFLFCGFTKPVIEGDIQLEGTPIKVNDYVENIYFNSNVGADVWLEAYESFNPDNNNLSLDLITFDDSSIFRLESISGTYYLTFKNLFFCRVFMSPFDITFMSDFIESFTINSNVIEIHSNFRVFKNLISSTPFVIPDDCSLVGTPLPTEQNVVDGLYLNTFLTPDEVVSILDNITFNQVIEGTGAFIYSPGMIIVSGELDGNVVNVPYFYLFRKTDSNFYRIEFLGLDVMTSQMVYLDLFYPIDGQYQWHLDEYNSLVVNNPIFNPSGQSILLSTVDPYEGNSFPSLYDNDKLGNLFSSTPFEIVAPPSFAEELINDLATVFIEYVPALTSAIVSMFNSLMFVEGSLTTLGTALLTIIGICLVSSIFRIVYKIFKGKSNRKI